MSTLADELDLLNSSRETYIGQKDVVDAAFALNPIMDLLWRNKKVQSGGTSIDFRTRIARPGTLVHYEGRTIPDRDVRPIFAAGTAPWRKAIYEIDLPGDTFIMNKDEGQIIDDAKETYDAGMEGIVENMATSFFADTGATVTPHGLPYIEADAAYFGISNANFRAVRTDMGNVPLTLTKVDEHMNALALRGARISVISCHANNYAVFQSSQRSNFQIAQTELKDRLNIGVPGRLYYNNAEIVLDPNCLETEVHFHDFRKFNMVVSSDPKRRLQIGEWAFQKLVRMDEYLADMMIAYNYICRNRQQQGVIHNINPA